ncbi:MAG TPA: hypothetical protein VGH05_13675 [Buttiauxella sp.]|jgi:hypothetical protein
MFNILKNKEILIVLFISIATICAIQFSINRSIVKKEHYETCKSDLVISSEDNSITALLDIYFYNGKGAVEIRGLYKNRDNKKFEIHRDVFFDYVKQRDKFILKSTEIGIGDDQNVINKVITQTMSVFFTQTGVTLLLSRVRAGNGDRIFSWAGLPILYCMK